MPFDVPAAVRAVLDAHGRAFAAPAGTVLFRPGDPCPGYILLDRGSVRVSLTGATGREATLYRVGPGEICVQTFQCLVNDETYVTLGAAERDLDGRLMGQAAFEQQMGLSEPFRRFVMGQVARRFESLTRAVELTAFTPIQVRLAAALLQQVSDGTVSLTHAALAAEIGSAREVVSRHLERLARAGMVALERNRIRLLAPDRLERLAQGER